MVTCGVFFSERAYLVPVAAGVIAGVSIMGVLVAVLKRLIA
jgi:hypothetical protein